MEISNSIESPIKRFLRNAKDAMLHGLGPKNTPFKSEGRRLFEQDFGIKVLTLEEILPPSSQPRIRIVQ